VKAGRLGRSVDSVGAGHRPGAMRAHTLWIGYAPKIDYLLDGSLLIFEDALENSGLDS
jgi:hypothetical protein